MKQQIQQALGDNVCMVFSGLTSEEKTVIKGAWMECQRCYLTTEDLIIMENINWLHLQSQTAQQAERREQTLIVSFDFDGTPDSNRLTLSGMYCAWKVNIVGWSAISERISTEELHGQSHRNRRPNL